MRRKMTKERLKHILTLVEASRACSHMPKEPRKECMKKYYKIFYPRISREIDMLEKRNPEAFKELLKTLEREMGQP